MMLPVTLTLTLLVSASVVSATSFEGISGSYCGLRPYGCCPDRRDDCSVAIEGTRCYCDDFCDRRDDDCCPDFFYVCRNATTPSPPNPTELGCYHRGEYMSEGTNFKINCNDCQCQRINYSMVIVCEQNQCMIDPSIMTEINQDRYSTWKAGNYSKFWGYKMDEGLPRRTGTFHSQRKVLTMRPIKKAFERKSLPLTYDLRREKRGVILPPLDQGWCAASWVMSTVGVATDRLAIMSKGIDRERLSPQHLLNCNFKNQKGCDGGHLTRAWKFIQKFGLVPEECNPWIGRQTQCTIPKTRNRNVTMARCSDGNRQMVLHRASPPYRVDTEDGIMNEIITSGPVQATMKVYQDFFMYRSGIYQCSKIASTHRTSYHSVRIVGWGEERQRSQRSSPVKFWIVANSWGEDWGENGYFRIRRGTNECGIETFVIGAWINPVTPKLDPMMSVLLPDRNNWLSNRV